MKKVILFILISIILLSTFVACTSEKGGAESNSSAPQSSSASSTKKIGNLDPNINLNEKEINIVSRNHPWNIDEVKVESQNADPINDAIYFRTKNVETTLNITIKNTLIPSTINDDQVVINEIKKTQGPDCPYHLAANTAYTSFANTSKGYFRNVLDAAHIDLTQDYWATKFNPEASMGNQQYFVTGAISLSLRRFIFVTFFNKTMATEFNLEDLYKVVNDGRWTIDYQADIISNMWIEKDGITGKTAGDNYGFLSDDGIFVDPYVSACDLQILVKDSDDYFVLDPEKEKADKMMSKINRLYWKSGASYIFARQSDYSQFDKIREKFISNEATMITDRLIAAESEEFKNMEAPYGILPIPKLDEAQQEYYSLAHDGFTVFGMINSEITDEMIDDLGAVLECMAIESQKLVAPAYYEIALKGKYSKDPESWEMLDMIVSNLKINGGLLYTSLGITASFRNATTAKANNSESIFNAVKLQLTQGTLSRLQAEIKAMQNQN